MVGAVRDDRSQAHLTAAHSSERLLPVVYFELRQLAMARLRQERAGHSLQATALVHEAYLRLVRGPQGSGETQWKSRSHFIAAVAEAMRRILVDHARRKRAQKRGGAAARITVDVDNLPSPAASFEVLALTDALTALEAEHPEHANLVKLRYFVGLTIAECADVLAVATPTIERRWRYARAWLAQRLSEHPDAGGTT